jgi:nucleotide-binding universal stress UspA family protein
MTDSPISATPDHHGGGRIVVGVDGSDASKDALHWALHQAEATGATLEALITWHIPTLAYGAAVPIPTDYDFAPGAKEILQETVAEVVGADPKVTISEVVEEGHPAVKLLEAAAGAELLVVGSRGHGGFAGMLLGSVSEYCVAHSPCPVVVVRHTRPAT